MINYRLRLISFFLPLVALLVIIRLAYWQIIRGPKLALEANRQHEDVVRLSAKRGQIYDANGYILAGTNNLYQLSVYKPSLDKDISQIIDQITTILGEETKPILTDRFKLKSNWISLKHYLTSQQKKQIEALNINGLSFEDEFVRFYPEASLSAHVLGFVGKDQIGSEKGYFGLEGYFDRDLQGREGVVKMEKDAIGRPILLGKYERLDDLEGRSIGSTLDRRIQHIAENLLSKGLERYEATAGGVIILESKTGKIRALASLPSYDPVRFSLFDQSLFKNPNVASLYEPGSTFKILIMAAALNEGLVSPQTECDICSGPVIIGKYAIKTWNNEYNPGSTMTDVIKNSDNTGMVYVGNKLGQDKLHFYLNQFGIGKKVGVELEEEVAGFLKPAQDIKDIDLATMSFGQGIAITPIQLIAAVNTIANRGTWIRPVLVDRIITSDKPIYLQTPLTRSVLSPQTARDMTVMMVNAVEHGEARFAIPKNTKIAGKTGTAQIPIEGHYDQDKTIASFVGFFPAEDPKYTMLVTLREPKKSPWGSETAAPLWFDIARELILF